MSARHDTSDRNLLRLLSMAIAGGPAENLHDLISIALDSLADDIDALGTYTRDPLTSGEDSKIEGMGLRLGARARAISELLWIDGLEEAIAAEVKARKEKEALGRGAGELQ